jgi:hypothetical protein
MAAVREIDRLAVERSELRRPHLGLAVVTSRAAERREQRPPFADEVVRMRLRAASQWAKSGRGMTTISPVMRACSVPQSCVHNR